MRRRNRKQQIAISEAELVAMTRDLDDAHHESLPSMRDSLVEWSESDDDIRSGITRLVSRPSSRRASLRFASGRPIRQWWPGGTHAPCPADMAR